MTRETAPYLLTPLDGRGIRQPRFILGPRLDPDYRELVDENHTLRDELEWLRHRSVDAAVWKERYEAELELRLRCQDRLSKCARVLAVLGHLYPQLRGVIGRAREDIWGGD